MFTIQRLHVFDFEAIYQLVSIKAKPISPRNCGRQYVSIYRSSSRSIAMASSKLNPKQNARTKSSPFCSAPESRVYFEFRNSTARAAMFMRTCNFKCSTSGGYILGQFDLRGVIRWAGMKTFRASALWGFPTSFAGGNFGRPSSSTCIAESKFSATVFCCAGSVVLVASTKTSSP